MISKHCGVRLRRITKDSTPENHTFHFYHAWVCTKCGKRFYQTVRKSKADQAIIDRYMETLR